MLDKEGGARNIQFAERSLDLTAQGLNAKQLVEAQANNMTAVGKELEQAEMPEGITNNEAESSRLVIKPPNAVLGILVAAGLVSPGEALGLCSTPFVPHHLRPQKIA
jgi:hypothetical protein